MRANRFDDLWLQHIEPAVVLLIDEFARLGVDGQPPEADRVHLALDPQVDAGAEEKRATPRQADRL